MTFKKIYIYKTYNTLNKDNKYIENIHHKMLGGNLSKI